MIRVTSEPFDPAVELRAFGSTNTGTGAGALASFVGIVRGDDGLQRLVLEHYAGYTERELARIEHAARVRFSLLRTLILHRVGALPPATPIVLVAALARHRREALSAVAFLMDHLKVEAPFWKREERANIVRHIEPLPSDHAALAAWKTLT